MGMNDVNPTLLIKRVAEELKKEPQIKPEDWAPFVKTGMSRERAPVQNDWWHIRAASILRKLFILGPVGTHKLQTQYGGRKNEGMAPEHFHKGSGNLIRKILQQLEKSGLAKQTAKGFHKGRIVTPRGHQLLESVASVIMKEQGVVLPARPKEAPKSRESADSRELENARERSSSEEKTEEAESAEKVKKPRAPRKKKEEAVPAQ